MKIKIHSDFENSIEDDFTDLKQDLRNHISEKQKLSVQAIQNDIKALGNDMTMQNKMEDLKNEIKSLQQEIKDLKENQSRRVEADIKPAESKQ